MAGDDERFALKELLRSWWPVLLGNILEWYEFAVFAYLSVAMAQNFFVGSQLATWAGFSVTFIARPLGGSVLAWVADTLGRRRALLASMIGMLVATVGQGLLPSRRCCGDAAGDVGLALLLLLRMMQGVCAGGEACAIATYCSEASPCRHLCLSTSLAPFTALLAFSIASGVVALCTVVLGSEAMLDWGWRLPFLLSLPGGLVSLWGRKWLAETEEFQRAQLARRQKECKLPHGGDAVTTMATGSSTIDGRVQSLATTSEILRERGLVVLLGILSMAACSTCFYGGVIWNVGHAKQMGLDHATADLIGCLAHITGMITIPLFSHMADRVGTASIMVLGALLVAVFAVPLDHVLTANPGDALVATLCISLGYGVVSGIALATSYPYFAGLFPTHTRALGFSLTFNMGMSYFGGLSAMISEALSRESVRGPSVYLASTGVLSAVSLLAAVYLRSRGVIRISYLRNEPFFLPGCCTPAKGELKDVYGKKSGAEGQARGEPEQCASAASAASGSAGLAARQEGAEAVEV